MQIQGKSWKDKLRAKIAEVAFYSKSFEGFLQKCTEYGIEYVYKPSNKVKLKFRLKDEGQQRFTRADTLGAEYTPERIAEQIQQRLSAAHTVAELKAPEKTVAPSKFVVTPKTEQKPTPPQSVITPTEPTKSRGLTEEEFFALLGEPTTPDTKPTESQAPEKKEDVWAEIRGMSNADQMIVDLESDGIKSLADLRSFFYRQHRTVAKN